MQKLSEPVRPKSKHNFSRICVVLVRQTDRPRRENDRNRNKINSITNYFSLRATKPGSNQRNQPITPQDKQQITFFRQIFAMLNMKLHINTNVNIYNRTQNKQKTTDFYLPRRLWHLIWRRDKMRRVVLSATSSRDTRARTDVYHKRLLQNKRARRFGAIFWHYCDRRWMATVRKNEVWVFSEGGFFLRAPARAAPRKTVRRADRDVYAVFFRYFRCVSENKPSGGCFMNYF